MSISKSQQKRHAVQGAAGKLAAQGADIPSAPVDPALEIVAFMEQIAVARRAIINGQLPIERQDIPTMEEFVLRHALPARRGSVLPAGVPMDQPKDCYRNAAHLAIANPGYTYCEGYAIRNSLPLPIQHAWVVDGIGRVIDSTWSEPERCQYLGVPFSRDELVRELTLNGVYGLLDTGRGMNIALVVRISAERAGRS
ncbi:hypothetical protein UFOVP119_36 [uncultured Caudovirales phage]|uniref:Uncharacterized protein n=1 Tax=uncultured Caudovirales phage TaxID=2100421 RepID=A0A6J5LAH2_9CAUD|nr:hypothetical protein UFOVP119_36 [uncultured Caudovirales phage]